MATILNLELDLPLAETPASRFLAWIAGGLVFLAVLALALPSAAGGTVRRLALEPQIVTVALPGSAGVDSPDVPTAGVMADLERLAGVAYVRVVPPDEVGRMIEPWLTTDTGIARLALPRLLDVAFNAAACPISGRCRLGSLSSRLALWSMRLRARATARRRLPEPCARWAIAPSRCCWRSSCSW